MGVHAERVALSHGKVMLCLTLQIPTTTEPKLPGFCVLFPYNSKAKNCQEVR